MALDALNRDEIMNYTYIFKPIPYPFKLIGYALGIAAIGVAITEKLSLNVLPESIKIGLVQATFLVALFLIMMSKGKIEDERSWELRLVVSSYGFYLIFFFLIAIVFVELLTSTIIPSERIYAMALIYMEIVVLIHEVFSRTAILNFMQLNKKYLRYYFALAAIPLPFAFFGLLKLNRWIWAWETLGG